MERKWMKSYGKQDDASMYFQDKAHLDMKASKKEKLQYLSLVSLCTTDFCVRYHQRREQGLYCVIQKKRTPTQT